MKHNISNKSIGHVFFALCWLTLGGLAALAKPLDDLIAKTRQSGVLFQEANLFDLNHQPEWERQVGEVVNNATLLTLRTADLQQLLASRPTALSLSIPLSDSSTPLIVDLVQQAVVAPDFTLRVSSDDFARQIPLGLHYRGVVRGSEGSLAAVSLFDGEVMGLIASSELGNLTLGQLHFTPGVYVCYTNPICENRLSLRVAPTTSCTI